MTSVVQARPASQRSLIRWLIQKLIVYTQWLPLFKGRGAYSGFCHSSHKPSDPLAKSKIEYEDHESAVQNLPGRNLVEMVRDKHVLDFGCGYGGRTVWLGEYAAQVDGIEVRPRLVEKSKAFAESRSASNVRFQLGSQLRLPYPDNHFDVVFSLDVMEHVQDPVATLDELVRVTKPGGTMVLIFTPYYGMFSHHLNYITVLPGLHWLFKPAVLVDAVNELLATDPRFSAIEIETQPPPKRSYNGKRLCLPTLNGMTRREYLELVNERPLHVVHLRSTPVLEKFPALGRFGCVANAILQRLPLGMELFSHNLVSVLTKSDDSQATSAARKAA